MTGPTSSLGEYLAELEKSKKDRDDQVREGLEIYIGLWKRAIEKGVASEEDTVEAALDKVDSAGGLYKVSED